MAKEVVVYARSTYCPYQSRAKRVFKKYDLDPRTIMIDLDPNMEQRVIDWTGFKSVPTVIIANPGEDLPYEEPRPLAAGESPRGVDRGSMITEASIDELTAWLAKHGIIET